MAVKVALGSGSEGGGGSGMVLVETDAYSSIVHSSLVALRINQRRRAAKGQRVEDA